jgi:hypothetical protein
MLAPRRDDDFGHVDWLYGWTGETPGLRVS